MAVVLSTAYGCGLDTGRGTVSARQLVVATGGLCSGLDALKALTLGADLAGFAGHLFRAAAQGPDGASREVGLLLEELKTGLFLLGVPHPSQLTEDPLA